jgi:hypothetical protein
MVEYALEHGPPISRGVLREIDTIMEASSPNFWNLNVLALRKSLNPRH